MVYCRLTLRPALFLRSSLARLVDQEIIELFPPLIAATSQRGLAPRPAQVSPDGPQYLSAPFLPLTELTRALRRPFALSPIDFAHLVLNYYHVGKIARRQRSRYRSGRPVGALTIVGAGDDRSSTPTIA